jgi:hypothetical protein
MANDIASLIDTAIWEMKDVRAEKAYEYISREYDSVENVVDGLNKCVHSSNKKGIINYDRQIERLTEAYGKAILDRNEAAKRDIEKEVFVLTEYSSEFIQCWERYIDELDRLNDVRSQMFQIKAEVEHRVSNVFIVDKAYKADKKAYPKKAIIVIVSTFSAFIVALLGFLFIDNFLKRIRAAS